MKISRLLLIAVVAALFGLTIFGVTVWNTVDVESATPSQAAARFASLRAAIGDTPPRLQRDSSGTLTRLAATEARDGPEPTHVCLAVYTPEHERLAEAEVPLWFVAMKAPAIDLVADQAGIDDLGITADQLLDEPVGLLFDEERAGGQRLLVWLK